MEKKFVVRILETKQVTHNVKRFRFEKPEGYQFQSWSGYGCVCE